MSDERVILDVEGTIPPSQHLPLTSGDTIDLAAVEGTTVIYVYPRTSPPNGSPIEGWDDIPGARGCTPQSCGFRDHYAELLEAGASLVFGLSAQSTTYQREMVERLHLPFAVISDEQFLLRDELSLPTFEAGGMELYKRITLVINNGKIQRAFFPIPFPEQNAKDVLQWLQNH